MIEVKAPQYPILSALARETIFLAGSIEMGAAEMWQDEFSKALEDLNVVIYNPRRDDWDSSWTQSINDPQFNDQVTWELKHLEKADIIPMYFAPTTKSPITLLEMGLYADSGKLIVCCPEGFWRKGNVDIVCREFGVEQVNSLDELVQATRDRLSLSNPVRPRVISDVSC